MNVRIEGVVEGALFEVGQEANQDTMLVTPAPGVPELGSPGWGIMYEPIGKAPLDDS